MREIKFRGKPKMTTEELSNTGFEESEWIEGNLIRNGSTPYIVGPIAEVTDEYLNHEFWIPVYPESVGQFTGLHDKRGKEIYEKDVLKSENGQVGRVFYWNDRYLVKWIKENYESNLIKCRTCEIIGNIYENPELLEAMKRLKK